MRLLCDYRDRSAEELKEILFSAAGDFCGHTFQDDAALMVVAVE